MKRLFLTSSVTYVAKDLVKRIENHKGMRLVFITTPVEIEDGNLEWLGKDRQSLIDVGFLITDYTITNKTKEEIEKDLQRFDVIYVSGGNTWYLLAKIQESNCAEVFRKLVSNGKIYIGTSAGSIIAGPSVYPAYSIENQEKASDLKDYTALNLVNFVVYPHWGSKDSKDKYLNQRLEHAYNTCKDPIIILNDNQYVIVEGDSYKIIDTQNK